MSIKKILISQPAPISEHNPYAEMEKTYGVSFDFHPMIQLEGLTASEFRLQRINPLDYTGVILNSKLAIEHYFRMMNEMRLKVPESMHYYCVSEAVGMYLIKFIQYRKRKVFFGQNNKFEDNFPAMKRRPEEKYMMVLSETYSEDTLSLFTDQGFQVQPAVMYRTVSAEWDKTKAFDYDMIVLFTPSGVQSVMQNFPDWKQGNTVVACFGKGTQEEAEKQGWTVQIKAPTPQFPGIAGAINDYLEKNK